MKTSFIFSMALAMGLVSAPMVEASANTASIEMTATAKKKTVKKTAKKTTNKKTTTKATTKATTTTTTKADTTTTASNATTTSTASETTAKSATSSSKAGLIGGILSAISGGKSEGGSLLSGLSAIFDATKGATKDRIIGTWTYTEPAVVFSSNNVLSSIGGKVAAQAIEKKLETQMEKLGIKKGMMKMTFDKDGNFTQVIGSKTMSGTYSISDHNVTLNYGGKLKQIIGTTQLDGNDLLIVMDASKLLKYASVLSTLTGSSALKTLGSAISSMNGMEVGLKLNK